MRYYGYITDVGPSNEYRWRPLQFLAHSNKLEQLEHGCGLIYADSPSFFCLCLADRHVPNCWLGTVIYGLKSLPADYLVVTFKRLKL